MTTEEEPPGDGSTDPPPGEKPEKPARLAWLRRGVTVLVSLAVLEYLVLPQVAGTRRALEVLGELRPGWVVAGVALEILSLVGLLTADPQRASGPTSVVHVDPSLGRYRAWREPRGPGGRGGLKRPAVPAAFMKAVRRRRTSWSA
jgi:hypothetical protein